MALSEVIRFVAIGIRSRGVREISWASRCSVGVIRRVGARPPYIIGMISWPVAVLCEVVIQGDKTSAFKPLLCENLTKRCLRLT